MACSPHPLDEALRLRPAPSSSPAAGRYEGQTHAGYWNMVGPFGGITAATLLQAVMQHPDRLGDPLALTVNYAGALVAGPFTVQALPVRSNRSTQHWTLSMQQAGADGAPMLTTSATAVTALRRQTWGVDDMRMPDVPAPADLPALPPGLGVEWLDRYEIRPICGTIPERWDGGGEHSLTRFWMRDAPARPLDFCALTALADVFFPRVWLRRARRVPVGTVSITVYFHADGAQLQETGPGYLLGQACGQVFRNGFFDQSAQLWNAAGHMLATSHQIVYYKE
ncbi:thioesterase family protein [Verminephrobacter aporrectodeae subsp. tuberculatae]|uniref:Thioesterase family protein n=1 Tax=Verminephrobacter aporrectodeae subsp. tuberculatae TaxID=1110392 RepID=A0ABT3KMZ1_9BURK|nr:thioesterase family protein [Verminephrobacter aporrectodeae]MCW5319693.1 thioesterase family protein [Verminephrobacter aporrectodeae subsp. tuberculatae]